MSGAALRITELNLTNVGPFPSLQVSFGNDPGINLVCGDNGVGKTTILEAITASFTIGKSHRLKRRQAAESGTLQLMFQAGGMDRNVSLNVNEMDPKKGEFVNSRELDAVNLIHIRAARGIQYHQQNSIARDPDFNAKNFNQHVSSDLNSDQIKAWLTNRYLLEPHSEKSSWAPQMKKNLDTAKDFFSLLDPDVSLSEVDVTTFEVMVSTPNGVIPFELMSSGFHSTYFLLLGILKEIEFRKLGVSAIEFSGVILVDEIDLHLHPSWQQEIGRILTSAFPNAQIIATLHSPHVVQTTNSNGVISLSRDSAGNAIRKSVNVSKYGYAGWTVEEILEEVMGVENTRTPAYRNALEHFDKAIDLEDTQQVNEALIVLREMLHPKNPPRKLVEIQSAPFAYDTRADDSAE